MEQVLFVDSPDKQKTQSLRSLWFDTAHHPESIEGRLCGEQIFVCVNLRESAVNFPLLLADKRGSCHGDRFR